MTGWLTHKDANPNYRMIKHSTEINILSEVENIHTRWEFLESTLFWLRDDDRPIWEKSLYPIQTKILDNAAILNNHHWDEVFLWIEYYPVNVWLDAPSENHRWRLRYNDGDDSYMEKYYDSQSAVMEEFEYLTLTNTYTELFATFNELNFQYW